MNFIYENINVNYEVKGVGKTIIILHGWGRNMSDFSDITYTLSKKYQVYLIDLPGFGKSDNLVTPFNLDDYVSFLKNFIDSNNINNPIIIGHSFGGRIALRYASLYKIDKMILIASAGIKRFSFKVKTKILLYKLKKRFYQTFNKITAYEKLISKSGSPDYKSSNDVMKKTLSNIVSINQRKDLEKIDIEVLLIWGKYDNSTPYKDALIMNKKINKSGLVTFNTGHFPFLEDRYKFKKVIENYLQIEDK